jgi:hypothetical protein
MRTADRLIRACKGLAQFYPELFLARYGTHARSRSRYAAT